MYFIWINWPGWLHTGPGKWGASTGSQCWHTGRPPWQRSPSGERRWQRPAGLGRQQEDTLWSENMNAWISLYLQVLVYSNTCLGCLVSNVVINNREQSRLLYMVSAIWNFLPFGISRWCRVSRSGWHLLIPGPAWHTSQTQSHTTPINKLPLHCVR